MNVSLSPRMETLVARKVESGLFGDASAVIEEALRLLDERDRIARLQAALAVGIAELERGEGILWTENSMQELLDEADEEDRLGLPISDDVLP